MIHTIKKFKLLFMFCVFIFGSALVQADNVHPGDNRARGSSLSPVYRVFTGYEHFYSLEATEGAGTNDILEGIVFSVFSQNDFYGLTALYRCRLANGTHLVTTQSNCENQIFEGVYGYVLVNPSKDFAPLYRFFNGLGVTS